MKRKKMPNKSIKEEWRNKPRKPYGTARGLKSNIDISKQYWDMIVTFLQRPSAAFHNKELMGRAAATYIATGMRRNELFLAPLPIMQKLIIDGKTYYDVWHVDQKHFEGKTSPKTTAKKKVIQSITEQKKRHISPTEYLL
jgi:hypothetical protein